MDSSFHALYLLSSGDKEWLYTGSDPSKPLNGPEPTDYETACAKILGWSVDFYISWCAPGLENWTIWSSEKKIPLFLKSGEALTTLNVGTANEQPRVISLFKARYCLDLKATRMAVAHWIAPKEKSTV